jgi:hypothetical protein
MIPAHKGTYVLRWLKATYCSPDDPIEDLIRFGEVSAIPVVGWSIHPESDRLGPVLFPMGRYFPYGTVNVMFPDGRVFSSCGGFPARRWSSLESFIRFYRRMIADAEAAAVANDDELGAEAAE